MVLSEEAAVAVQVAPTMKKVASCAREEEELTANGCSSNNNNGDENAKVEAQKACGKRERLWGRFVLWVTVTALAR